MPARISWLLIAGGFAASPAFAQDNSTDQIIVTANIDRYAPRADTALRTDTPTLLVPFTSETVGAGLIADQGLTSMQDALRSVAGAAPVSGIGNFNTRFRLRGFAPTSNLRNGFRQSLSVPVTEIQFLDRIEVLKGPASMLYGRFEPGGAINLVTKRPLATTGGVFGGMVDDNGLIRLTGDVNLATGDNGVRINGVYDNGKTFRAGVDNRTIGGHASGKLSLGADTTLFIEGEYVDRDGVFDRGFVTDRRLLDLPPSRFLGDTADVLANRTWATSALIEHRLTPDWRLRAGGSVARGVSVGAYFFPQAFGGALVTVNGLLNRRYQETDDVQRDESATIELLGKFDTGSVRHTLLLAGDWNRDRGTSLIRRSAVNAPISIFDPLHGAPRGGPLATIVNTASRAEALAALGQIESQWTPWLRTTLGLRVERLTASFTNRAAAVNPTQSSRDTAATPRIGVTLLPTQTVSVFASWGRSFAAEVGTRPIIGNVAPEPSRGEQIEAGLRFESVDGRLRAQAAGFHVEKTNIRVAEPAPSPFDRQAGKQRSQGFEIDASIQPVTPLTLEFAYAYIDATVVADPVLAGRRLPQQSDHSASAWMRYDFTPQFGAGAGVFLVSDRFQDGANSFSVDGYARADAAIYWRPIERVTVQVNLLNAANARYFENGNTNNNLYPGQPRTLRGSIRVAL